MPRLSWVIRKALPRSAANAFRRWQESAALVRLPRSACHVENLTDSPPVITPSCDWSLVERHANSIPTHGGAVNPGDRRALYVLALALRPNSVLEVGTHLGGSTVMFALALKNAASPRLVSVDIEDVNGADGAWTRYGGQPPQALISQIGCDGFVRFVARPSLEFMASCPEKFDLIFLDGCHDAAMVYREVPLALKLLNPGGLILLHDFFPDMKALWSDGNVIPGPWLAVERFKKEGARIKGLPLGALPWPTKFNSNVTSLAYLVRA